MEPSQPSVLTRTDEEVEPQDFAWVDRSVVKIVLNRTNCSDWQHLFKLMAELSFTQLVLASCSIPMRCIPSIASVSQLERLVLSTYGDNADNIPINLHCLEMFPHMRRLRQLSIVGSPLNHYRCIDSKSMHWFSHLARIQQVILPMPYVEFLGLGFLQRNQLHKAILLIKFATNVEKIRVSFDGEPEEQVLEALDLMHSLQHLKALDVLRLKGSAPLLSYSAGALGMVASLQHLTELSVGINFRNVAQSGIGDQGLTVLADNLQELTSLDIQSCRGGPAGLAAIAKSMVGLESLNIENNRIDSEAVWELCHRLRNLKKLEMGGVSVAGGNGNMLSMICYALPNITEFEVSTPQVRRDSYGLHQRRKSWITKLGRRRNSCKRN